MRLFIAIELPDDLKRLLGRLRSDIPGARWVPTEQIHLTMAFLGEVEESTQERLKGELARIYVPAFQLRFTGIGCFPNPRRPRVVWIGLEPEALLTELAARVREAVLTCGIPQEERPFSPHITLARLKVPSFREIGVLIEQHQKQKLPPFQVREFKLFESRLTPQGAIHTPLNVFSLSAAGGLCR